MYLITCHDKRLKPLYYAKFLTFFSWEAVFGYQRTSSRKQLKLGITLLFRSAHIGAYVKPSL